MFKFKPTKSQSWSINVEAPSIFQAFQGQVPDYAKRKRLDLIIGDLGLHTASYANPMTLMIGTKAYDPDTRLRLNLVCTLFPDDMLIRPFSSSKAHIEFMDSVSDRESLQEVSSNAVLDKFNFHIAEMNNLKNVEVESVVADRACFLASGVPDFFYQDYLLGKTLPKEAKDLIEAGYQMQNRIRKVDKEFKFDLRVHTVYKVIKRLCPPHNTATVNSTTLCNRSWNLYQYLTWRAEYGLITQQ